MEEHSTLKREKIIQFNEGAVRDHLGEMVRSTVEETLNQMLEAEADRLCNTERYERTEARVDTRAGHYRRKLQTRAGEVSLNMPKLRRQTFETAIIERYRRRTRVVGAFPDGHSALMLCAARLRHIAGTAWGRKRYLNMELLKDLELEEEDILVEAV